MFISILIPVYNWDIALLVRSLVSQIEESNLVCEIIIADDASTIKNIQETNTNFITSIDKSNIHYYALEKNIGRSKIRNFLFEKSQGNYLLFLDADTLPDSNLFLKKYADTIHTSSAKIVLGGISYNTVIKKDPKYTFYLYMGRKLGEISPNTRLIDPWRYVITSNILINSRIFQTFPIDNNFEAYGYEDTEWGIRLMKASDIVHIDNTVSHLGLETKQNLLSKVFTSTENFHKLVNKHNAILKTWKLNIYVNKTSYLPSTWLSNILILLLFIFKYSPINQVSLIVFQAIKVAAFAKYKKDNISLIFKEE